MKKGLLLGFDRNSLSSLKMKTAQKGRRFFIRHIQTLNHIFFLLNGLRKMMKNSSNAIDMEKAFCSSQCLWGQLLQTVIDLSKIPYQVVIYLHI
jgi:hypothetical protein